ncbi:hypothetical protein D043_1726B, partial [Vibrio parahaemolyticus EKP-021]
SNSGVYRPCEFCSLSTIDTSFQFNATQRYEADRSCLVTHDASCPLYLLSPPVEVDWS